MKMMKKELNDYAFIKEDDNVIYVSFPGVIEWYGVPFTFECAGIEDKRAIFKLSRLIEKYIATLQRSQNKLCKKEKSVYGIYPRYFNVDNFIIDEKISEKYVEKLRNLAYAIDNYCYLIKNDIIK